MRQLIYPMKEQYEEYVIDEAKFSGYAQSISFPENEEEIFADIHNYLDDNIINIEDFNKLYSKSLK